MEYVSVYMNTKEYKTSASYGEGGGAEHGVCVCVHACNLPICSFYICIDTSDNEILFVNSLVPQPQHPAYALQCKAVCRILYLFCRHMTVYKTRI